MNLSVLISDIGLTFLAYMAYPFIQVKLLEKTYDEESAQKMALYNSIIVKLIFIILQTSIYGEASFSVGAAVLYYFINRSVWVDKKSISKNQIRKNSKKENSKCVTKKKKRKSNKNDDIIDIMYIAACLLVTAILFVLLSKQ